MTLLDYKNSTGKTYREIAEETQVSHSTIYRVCRGGRPSLTTVEKLVKSRTISVKDILRGGDQK